MELNKHLVVIVTGFLVGLLLNQPLVAQTAPAMFANATALEKELLSDAEDGRLDDFTLIEAAFAASGLPERADLERFQRKFEGILDRARVVAAEHDTDYQRARAVFKLLHKEVFKSYAIHAVDMVSLFNRGDYNCVSATIVFNAVLGGLNMESQGILVPSHAFSVVRVDGRWVDVETTSPSGFNPARTSDEYRKLLKTYGLDGSFYETRDGKKVAKTGLIKEVQGTRQPVSNLTLVAVIYNNLGAARVRDADLEGALSAFTKASALSKESSQFRKARDALINNLIVDLIDAREYRRAIIVCKAAQKINGLGTMVTANLQKWSVHAWSKMAIVEEDAGHYRESVAVYDEALRSHPGSRILIHNRKSAYIAWALARLRKAQYRESATVILATLKLYKDDPLVQKNYLAIVQKYVRSRREVQDLKHAEKIARYALDSVVPLYSDLNQTTGFLARLHLEIGLVLFVEKRFGEALEEFAHGLNTGEDIYVGNFLAAAVNQGRMLSDAGKTDQAYLLADSILPIVSSAAAKKHGFYDAYWAFALNHAQDLLADGQVVSALAVMRKLPADTIAVDSGPAMLNLYVQLLSRSLAESDRKNECRQLLMGKRGSMESLSWYEGRLKQCSD
jgi:tetratricopeptide (TPR) repeat protein